MASLTRPVVYNYASLVGVVQAVILDSCCLLISVNRKWRFTSNCLQPSILRAATLPSRASRNSSRGRRDTGGILCFFLLCFFSVLSDRETQLPCHVSVMRRKERFTRKNAFYCCCIWLRVLERGSPLNKRFS